MYEGTDKMKEKEKENAWGKQFPLTNRNIAYHGNKKKTAQRLG